ncbi:uncharacterized protein METZ01_LOCUS425116, partial [marine metagenome]
NYVIGAEETTTSKVNIYHVVML